MSDLEPKRKLEHDEKAPDSSKGRAFDAGTRNVESAQVKAAENANPHRHSGSAGGDQEHSLEIVGFGATVSRKTQLTEKDLPKVPTEQIRQASKSRSGRSFCRYVCTLSRTALQ